MASFNPTVNPTSDPNYLRYSNDVVPGQNIRPQGVEQNTIVPKGNTHVDISEGLAYKSAGDIISGVSSGLDFTGKVVDTLIKKSIDDNLYKALDAERTRYSDQLAGILTPGGDTDKVNRPDTIVYGGGGQGDQGPPAPTEDLPTPLENLPRTLANLSAASEGGSISGTYYQGRLNEIAKSFRAQYPGYRDYIDSEVSKVTGGNPANKLLAAQVQQINKLLTGQKSERDKTEALIRSNIDLPNAPQMFAAFRSGSIDDNTVNTWLNRNLGDERYWKFEKARRENIQGGREEVKQNDETNLNVLTTQVSRNRFESVMTPAGWTPEKVSQFITEVNNGTRPRPSDADSQQLGEYIKAQKTAAAADIRKKAADLGWYKTLGPEAIEKKIADTNKQFDDVGDLILNHDYGSAFHAANFNKAVSEDSYSGFLKNEDLSKEFLKIQAVKRAGGEQFLTGYFGSLLSKGLSTKLQTYSASKTLGILSQDNFMKTGVPQTIKAAVEDAEAKGIKTPQVFEDFVGLVDKIPDEKTPDAIKENIIQAAFAPEGKGFIAKDWKDAKGNDMRYNIFRRMTSPDIRDTVYRLGQKNPVLWDHYIDWVETSFGQDLFSREINGLKDVQAAPGVGIGWNTDTLQLQLLVDGKDVSVNRLSKNTAAYTQALKYKPTIDRLNKGLLSIGGVAEKQPNFDVENYLLNTLMDNGFTPNKQTLDNLPDHIAKAIFTSRLKMKEKNEERNKKWNLE